MIEWDTQIQECLRKCPVAREVHVASSFLNFYTGDVLKLMSPLDLISMTCINKIFPE